ncbi:MAG: hypothetical protein KBC12_03560 [Candidatus Pacebacteria bacterium]|nr:hypothetical protein [Candidatus Paceibacterota bacterium]MBP9851266.1 hypothetical protein [Candidatus Paceibacterota bacterium]
MSKNLKNKQGGFLEVIISIVIFLLIMRYYGLTFTGVWAWIENLFWSVW